MAGSVKPGSGEAGAAKAKVDEFVREYVAAVPEAERAEACRTMEENYGSFLAQERARSGGREESKAQLSRWNGAWMFRQVRSDGRVQALIRHEKGWWAISGDHLSLLRQPSFSAVPDLPWLGADLPGLDWVNERGLLIPEARDGRGALRLPLKEAPNGGIQRMADGERALALESDGPGPAGLRRAEVIRTVNGRPAWRKSAHSFRVSADLPAAFWEVESHLRDGLIVTGEDGTTIEYRAGAGTLGEQLAAGLARDRQAASVLQAGQARTYGLAAALLLGIGGALFALWSRRRPRAASA